VAIGLDGQQLAEVSDARRLDIELLDLVDQTPGTGALSLANRSLLRSSVITVALSLPLRRHGRLDLAWDARPQ
jgi:hypothetical protein